MTDAPSAKELDTALAEAQRTWKAPGVVAAVVREGVVVWKGAVGQSRVGEQDAATDQAYRIGSITKTFTAVLVHQLRDEGRLDLDAPIATWVPGTGHDSVTPRRLLAHASGLQRELGDMWVTLETPDRDDLMRLLQESEQVLAPHVSHHYSNLAYALLGELVAQVTDSTWEEQLQSRLLDPLGMARTSLQPTEPRAQGYLTDPYADAVRPEPDTDTGAAGPAMQLWSTAEDLARWAAFLADPDPAVLSVDTLEAMRQPIAVFDPWAFTLAWGGGLMLWRRGERVVHGHGGAMPGFLAGCYAYRDETERAGAVVLTNTGRAADPETLAADLLGKALDADPRTKPAWTVQPVPDELRPLLGPWWSEGAEFVFEHRDGELTALVRGGTERRRTRFRQTGPDAFQAYAGRERGERLTLHRDAQGVVTRMTFSGYAYTRDPRTFSELSTP